MGDAPHFRIGTRGSDLARWQAHYVRDLIESRGGTCDIQILSTQGDREQVQAFEKLEGKGFFTKEIEQALLDHTVDLAVHSHKDLETRQPHGLTIAAVPPRAAAQDVLLIRRDARKERPWLPLSKGATVGTSSVRRRDQLLLLRPDLQIEALRGNVPTRVDRLREGRYDAIVLAAAGLDRLELDLSDLVRLDLDARHFVPAPAQGALALQMREGDPKLDWLRKLSDAKTATNIESERAILRALEGGCQLPFGAHVRPSGGLRAFLQTPTGPRRIVASDSDSALHQLQKAPKAQRILITRAPKKDVLHRLAASSGDTLVEWSGNVLTATGTAGPNVACNWVWLTSPGAATIAADWMRQHDGARIAAAGPGTAESIPDDLMARVHHIGDGDPLASWAAFSANRSHGDDIAIPHSTLSKRRWETEQATPFTVHPWPAYSTAPRLESAPDADVVCFTSPSNVRHWSGDQPARIVAIGPTTSDALSQQGWAHTTAKHPDAFGIWEAIQEG